MFVWIRTIPVSLLLLSTFLSAQSASSNPAAAHEKALAMNVLIRKVNSALGEKRCQDAITPLQQLIVDEPSSWQFRSGLGDCEFEVGNYADAAQAYHQGIGILDGLSGSAATSTSLVAQLVHMLVGEGSAYSKIGRSQDALEPFRRATVADPKDETAWFDVCMTEYNVELDKAAFTDCSTALDLDPNKADAYFVKGMILVADARAGTHGAVTVDPSAVEMLKKYTSLSPNGVHASVAYDALTFLNRRFIAMSWARHQKSRMTPVAAVSGNVMAGKLANDSSVRYSDLARAAHVHGDVVLQVMVGKDGRVDSLEVKTGHVLLIDGAIQAVKNWRYSPYLVDRKPVSVDTTVTLKFHY